MSKFKMSYLNNSTCRNASHPEILEAAYVMNTECLMKQYLYWGKTVNLNIR